MTIDRLSYAPETPVWLSIHKRWLEDKSCPTTAPKTGRTSKPFKLRTESGDILEFKSGADAADKLGVAQPTITEARKRMRRSPEHKAKINKITYYMVFEK